MDRFWSKVFIPFHEDGCWHWRASNNKKGYGQFWFKGKMIRAHRFSYELEGGIIPEGFDLHHVCENQGCVNPSHLKIVAHERHRSKHTKSHCYRGHERILENLTSSKGCSICQKINGKEYYQANKEMVKARSLEYHYNNREELNAKRRKRHHEAKQRGLNNGTF